MRLIQAKCPSCGAVMKLAADQAPVVKCEYCNTEAFVQRRTGLMRRLEPPPARTSKEPSGRADLNRRPPAPKAGALTRLRYAPKRRKKV